MASGPVTEIDAPTAQSWMNHGDTLLLDVRERDEHGRERIPGAQLMPLAEFDPSRLDLQGKCRIVVHCASGGRSMKAAELLRSAGHDHVASLAGGLSAWRRAGLPVDVDRRAPLPLMRQVQLIAGSLVLAGVLLGAFVHPSLYLLSGFVGSGLIFAGATGWCGMAMLLAKLPYNRPA